ncbi:MAG: 30S ribosomal protein S18 [Deltaproteobacteria bacterium GWA2_38_16]|nr:MAG: 30S ribosomal protein S18 [Deltaproteobacteria bacterium GWA2_38_16]OGQ02871.1 MAG: 30S ribosomal protein S18 [Deltaproteobacteria bacterium RIFCSPHIGHO2_02_FULL_38_15]OGQ35112.1 MAG: 30S ribosomal protein S18 [Deltaproteobacteria bacterium RIFCSPLOWO2_01_FULL_38_9]OGQ61688.1 MAG: 30S ribosomal protein S18 [Deltaproteobacteria bacterium RIFCSPLOWO2_12_FULL_38_8]HBQ21717.1 30S ribosomal protein S18 [Deltaproteobacteria bacterium]
MLKEDNRKRRKKSCRFCADTSIVVDYKNQELLENFVTENAKIVPSRISGACAFHQRALTTAIKRARQIAILPYTICEV